ncbi:MAG: sigma-70 family RNA polymerase sigma factor [bacterium]|nr:sigma-70 family RNA polymerase sigma factor [bacterium]
MLESNEKNRLIQQAIDSLPKDKRTIIILRALEGLSYEQITEITGVKTGTVKTRIFRAREILQKELEGVL